MTTHPNALPKFRTFWFPVEAWGFRPTNKPLRFKGLQPWLGVL